MGLFAECADIGTASALCIRRRGGPPRKHRRNGGTSPRSISELAGSAGSGRGYEPRLARQRIGSYDRLAWINKPPRTQSVAPGLGCTDSSAGWRDGSRRDRMLNPVSGFGAKRSIPGGSSDTGRSRARPALGDVQACVATLRPVSHLRRCRAHHTPESAAHTATAAEVAPRRRFHSAPVASRGDPAAGADSSPLDRRSQVVAA